MKKSKKSVNEYLLKNNEKPTVVNYDDIEVDEEDIADDEYDFYEEFFGSSEKE